MNGYTGYVLRRQTTLLTSYPKNFEYLNTVYLVILKVIMM